MQQIDEYQKLRWAKEAEEWTVQLTLYKAHTQAKLANVFLWGHIYRHKTLKKVRKWLIQNIIP